MSKDNFNARKSKINAAFARTLGKRHAEPYLVEALEPLTGKEQSRLRPYGLRIPPEAISIAAQACQPGGPARPAVNSRP
jgi:hypothetical protein